MHQHKDGQVGAVTWHNAEFGEFISTTGARFTVRADEVKPFADGARRVKAREMLRDAGDALPQRKRYAVPEFKTGAALRKFVWGELFAGCERGRE